MGEEPTLALGPQSKPRPLPLRAGCRTRARCSILCWVRPCHPKLTHPVLP